MRIGEEGGRGVLSWASEKSSIPGRLHLVAFGCIGLEGLPFWQVALICTDCDVGWFGVDWQGLARFGGVWSARWCAGRFGSRIELKSPMISFPFLRWDCIRSGERMREKSMVFLGKRALVYASSE